MNVFDLAILGMVAIDEIDKRHTEKRQKAEFEKMKYAREHYCTHCFIRGGEFYVQFHMPREGGTFEDVEYPVNSAEWTFYNNKFRKDRNYGKDDVFSDVF